MNVFLTDNELKRRIIARNAYRDLDKIESDRTWQNFLSQIHFEAKNPLPHILINTEDSQETNFAIAKKYLQKTFQHVASRMSVDINLNDIYK